MFRQTFIRKLPYPNHGPMKLPKLPALPPSALPQFVEPTKLQKSIQMTGFVLAIGLTIYSVLLYDFGDEEHCFKPVRRWFDDASSGFFTLSDGERQLLGSNAGQIHPSTKTPIQFFKEESESEE